MNILNFKTLKKLSYNFSLLYVEDDDLLREKSALIFRNLFHRVDVACDGREGLALYKKSHYDIVVSDIEMPYLSGIELTKEIFKLHKNQAVIIVSAYNDHEYLIELINIGVDAFMQKPLSSQNIIEVFYKVCSSFTEQNIVSLGDNYTYHLDKSILFFNQSKVELSENELKLLELLIKNKEQSFSAVEIFNHIYFSEPEKEFSVDAIKSLVKRLRKKLPPNFISNTHQLGYSVSF